MPLYEFDCRDCDSPFEKFVRGFSAIDSVTCPECGGNHVAKRMSSFASSVQGGTIPLASAPASSCAPGGT